MAYDNPAGLIAAAVIVQSIVLAFVFMRLLARRKRGVSYHASEYVILVATVATTALTVMQIYGAAAGLFGVSLGATAKDPGKLAQKQAQISKLSFAMILLHLVTGGLVKISASLLYIQIFSVKNFKRIISVWIFIVALWTTGWTLQILAQCGSHFNARFNNAAKKKYCATNFGTNAATTIFHPVSDLITVLAPIPMIISLQLPRRQKIIVSSIFLVGFLSVGASSARAYIYLASLLGVEKLDYGTIITSTTTWSLIEVQTGIIAACAPTLRPMIDEIRKNSTISSLMESARGFVSRSSISEPRTSKAGSMRSDREHSFEKKSNVSAHAIYVETEVNVDSHAKSLA